MSEAQAPPSIRRRMLMFLISSLIVMVAGASASSPIGSRLRSANDAYDRSLLDPALDIAENLRIDAGGAHVDLPVKALEALVYDQVDRVIFQVRSPADAIIVRCRGPAAAARARSGAADILRWRERRAGHPHRRAPDGERLRGAGRGNAAQAQPADRRNPGGGIRAHAAGRDRGDRSRVAGRRSWTAAPRASCASS